MSTLVSFPNFLCLLLTGFLVVHLACRNNSERSLPRSEDRLEAIYCRLPQSRRIEESRHCLSAQKLFQILSNDCSFERKKKKTVEGSRNQPNITETLEQAEDLEENEEVVVSWVKFAEEVKVEAGEEPDKEVKNSLVDSFIISLLVCSALFSLLEWYREKAKKKKQMATGEVGTKHAGDAHSDRRISIADLTVNRHIRKGEAHQLDTIRHVSTSAGSKPPLLRRSSFPAQIPEGRSRHVTQRQQSTPASPVGRRLSVDLGEDDGSPERRRVRIIRRH